MNLRSVDLNLLVVFDAMMRERNVTRAAKRVAKSQPATSNALARLRQVFDDELFVRTVKSMEPTPRAIELSLPIQQILHDTTQLFVSDVAFDPGTANHVFRARMSDLVSCMVLPSLVSAMREAAPNTHLDIEHISPSKTVRALESDDLDFAVSMELVHGKAIQSQSMFKDRMVCVMRAGHRLDKTTLPIEDLVQADHLRVAMSPTDIRFVDNVLVARGLKRNIVVNVPHWLMIPPVVRETDLIAVVSEKLAKKIAERGISIVPLGFETSPFAWRLYWHRRYGRSAPHCWMRGLIQRVCADL